MAIYHLSVKAISRSAGRSATAAAAYRAGVEITDVRTGLVHDYTRRGGVESAFVTLPPDAPTWALDRAALWNAAEAAEGRKNSTVAREFEVALPAELSIDRRRALVAVFAGELAAKHGIAVDAALHLPGKEGDHRNHHAHILTSTRRLGPDGFGEKSRELDAKATGPALVVEWRARWAELANAALEQAGRSERIDHRSLATQGIDRAPTVHLGPKATAMERAAARWSQRGEQNREIVRENADRAAAVVALADVREQRARAEAAEAEARERARLAALPLSELRAEVRRLAPWSFEDLVAAQPAAQALAVRAADAQRRMQTASAMLGQLDGQLGEWRDSLWHRLREKAHSVVPHPRLQQLLDQREKEEGVLSAARAEHAAARKEREGQMPTFREAAAREHTAQVQRHALAEQVLAEQMDAEQRRQDAVGREQAVRDEAQAVAASVMTANVLYRRGELTPSLALAVMLDRIDTLQGTVEQRQAALAAVLVKDVEHRQKIGDWLEPHAAAIAREQRKSRSRDAGPSMGR